MAARARIAPVLAGLLCVLAGCRVSVDLRPGADASTPAADATALALDATASDLGAQDAAEHDAATGHDALPTESDSGAHPADSGAPSDTGGMEPDSGAAIDSGPFPDATEPHPDTGVAPDSGILSACEHAGFVCLVSADFGGVCPAGTNQTESCVRDGLVGDHICCHR